MKVLVDSTLPPPPPPVSANNNNQHHQPTIPSTPTSGGTVQNTHHNELDTPPTSPSRRTSPVLFFAAAVISFDATLGHCVSKVIYDQSSSRRLTSEDEKAVARLSLPDSSSDYEGDSTYVFRFRASWGDSLFASVLFRQKKDASEPRGYVQKSLVLLSVNPLSWSILRECCKILGPLYFAFGDDVLQRACDEYFDQVRGAGTQPLTSFSLAGTRLVSTASAITMSPHSPTLDTSSKYRFLSDVPLFTTFGGLCIALWQIWEMVITGEPILVLGPTADRVSIAVLAIVSLAAPATGGIDYRPYMTIYDSDFNRFTVPQASKGVVLGTTNPFFLRSLETSFPNVISLGSSKKSHATSLWRKGTIKSLLKDRLWERALVVTRDDAIVAPDDAILADLRLTTQFSSVDPMQALTTNDVLLRQHFADLTSSFLAPLDHFIKLKGLRAASSATGTGSFTPYHEGLANHVAESFNPEAFLASLPRTPSKSTRFPKLLYKRFITGPNFASWFDKIAHEHAQQRLSIHRHLIIHTDAEVLVRSVSSSKLPDAPKKLIAKVSGTLAVEMAKPQPDSELLDKIGEHLTALRKSVTV